MPFWNTPDAFGDPIGEFPTTRCNDGFLVFWQRPCPEVGANGWLMQRERFLVAQSRQTYVYGVLFHMTGNPGFMELMKAGVRAIRSTNFDRESGGLRTQTVAPAHGWGPRVEHRDPQQLAYGLLGLSMYYYLTRDEEVLPDILDVKNYVFSRYHNPQLNALKWLLADNGGTRASEKRLVAQLDQMNAYMVLLTPLLAEPYRAEFRRDLHLLTRVMREEFWNGHEGLFFLNANRDADLDPAQSATDFGHNIKAMWMIRFAGRLYPDPELVNFAETEGKRILDRAFLPANGSWANGVRAGGSTDTNKSWWIYAELDQFAASLGMTDPDAARYLPATQRWYLDHFVDRAAGEVWTELDNNGRPLPGALPKQWPWKNGYHSLEHALVSYIAAQQIHGLPVTLYFHWNRQPPRDQIRPYLFEADVEDTESWTDGAGGLVWRIAFRNVR
jgi:mannose/cellobiose epimerase-like protein (N-acyl-D-glucosamine 2-epimerase family)